MAYHNQFEKEAMEKSLKAIAEKKKSPMNYEEELKRHIKMHKDLREAEEKELKNQI